MYKKISFAVAALLSLLVVGCLGGWGGSSSSKKTSYPASSTKSRDKTSQMSSAPRAVTGDGGANLFRLPMADGQPVTVKSPAMLFFFTSWCGYCKQVMPEFIQMTTRARQQGWRVYGIQVGEDSKMANSFITQYRPNFPILVDQQSLVARQYRVKGYPTFIIIDENANIIYNDHALPRRF